MKVSGLGTVRRTTTRRAGAKSSGEQGFRIDNDPAETAAPAVQGGKAVQPVGGLLSLQEVPDATEERSQGLKHGRDLLDELEQVRLGLLAGRIPRARLAQLLRLTQQRAQQYQDPRLVAILREIEVRAAVELAKIEKSGGKPR